MWGSHPLEYQQGQQIWSIFGARPRQWGVCCSTSSPTPIGPSSVWSLGAVFAGHVWLSKTMLRCWPILLATCLHSLSMTRWVAAWSWHLDRSHWSALLFGFGFFHWHDTNPGLLCAAPMSHSPFCWKLAPACLWLYWVDGYVLGLWLVSTSCKFEKMLDACCRFFPTALLRSPAASRNFLTISFCSSPSLVNPSS